MQFLKGWAQQKGWSQLAHAVNPNLVHCKQLFQRVHTTTTKTMNFIIVISQSIIIIILFPGGVTLNKINICNCSLFRRTG